ncbi:MAG: exodeoxyribonuclease VII large subunit [Candidatus Promineofilum sp.]|uniref:exodeoxyribonuclease VII large subunit n=1 Tax=Promineifilum sp. TaxID=2664178 RepID=UPI00241202AE|nr:exodeoxyribonuclease VII large subunit [Promineifilum sp.]MCO5180867.1 exodeoxyribonuclease VII large subunit [Promineifilum sp.]
MFPFLNPSAGADKGIWTVGELTTYIREMFELDYRLQDVEVTGELSNFTRAASGHLYFTLKDGAAQIKCVMWRTQAERLRFRPAEGDAILARGRISVYEVAGVYQLYAESLQPAGRGDLAVAFERLKESLAAEGLFDAEHKQPLPRWPRKIGIVTSSGAAALRDILTVLQRRNPFVAVLIAPTLVQGELAPAQIVRALRWLDGRDDIDTIIIARGGGSIEDLWAFNDERVARAVFTARHPVISGIGHETDFTITDFVADLRAPTPSAAAELAVPDLSEIRPVLRSLSVMLDDSLRDVVVRRRESLARQIQVLWLLNPRRLVDADRQQVDMLTDRLTRSAHRVYERQASRLAVARAGLMAASPEAALARGFAVVRDTNGRVISRVAQAQPDTAIIIQVSDGFFGARVDGQSDGD